jgi:hypothetical protein
MVENWPPHCAVVQIKGTVVNRATVTSLVETENEMENENATSPDVIVDRTSVVEMQTEIEIPTI